MNTITVPFDPADRTAMVEFIFFCLVSFVKLRKKHRLVFYIVVHRVIFLLNTGMELSSSIGDSNHPLVNFCIPTYVGGVTWSYT
jgi:hypothetical protein